MRREDRRPRLRAAFDGAAAALGSALDAGQGPAADRLALLGAQVLDRHEAARGAGNPGRWHREPVPRGVYLHGPVGRGKTWLAETLLRQLPGEGVLRLHAFEAARRLHAGVARAAGARGALERAVAALLDGAHLLFLDEFHAHDPGDAMLLARLVRALPPRGTTLLATSNQSPHGLLPDPQHHHLVLPLIAALEEGCDVVELAGPLDHRERGHGGARPGWSSGRWHWPGDPAGPGTPAPSGGSTPLRVGGRPLPVLAVEGDRVEVTFAALCEGLTSVGDLLELTDRFRTVVLTGVPLLSAASPAARRRFANLVDVLCDRDVRLVVLADGPAEEVLDVAMTDAARMVSRVRLLGSADGFRS